MHNERMPLQCIHSWAMTREGHPVWCINHSTEPILKKLQPYGDNADRCPPVCAFDSLSDTAKGLQIISIRYTAIIITVHSNKLKN